MAAYGDTRLPQRFWAKVQPDLSGCWLWTASLVPAGYAQWAANGKKVHGHRAAYRALVGPVPEGLELDHLCRVRRCVNPAHLEPVTRRENLLRGQTHAARNAAKGCCPRGHVYDRVIPRTNGTVGRGCRECQRVQDREYRARHRDVVAARKLAYARKNKDAINAYHRDYYRRTKEAHVDR